MQPGTAMQMQPGTAMQMQPGTAMQMQPGTAMQMQPGTAMQMQPGTAMQMQQRQEMPRQPMPQPIPQPVPHVHMGPAANARCISVDMQRHLSHSSHQTGASSYQTGASTVLEGSLICSTSLDYDASAHSTCSSEGLTALFSSLSAGHDTAAEAEAGCKTASKKKQRGHRGGIRGQRYHEKVKALAAESGATILQSAEGVARES